MVPLGERIIMARKDKLDKLRDKVEKIMYDVAIIMAEAPYELSYKQIRENFEISIDDTIDLLEYQYPEIED